MNKSAGWAVLALILVFGGCADKKSEASTSQANPPAQEQASQPEPAPQATPPVQPGPEQSPALAEPARPEVVAQLAKLEPSPAAAPPAPAPQPKAELPRPPEAKPASMEVATPDGDVSPGDPGRAASACRRRIE